MSIFSDDCSKLIVDLQEQAGEDATYKRGATSLDIVTVPAQVGQRVQTEAGVSIIGSRQDFLIRKDELPGLDKPQRGDILTLTGSGEVYEVQPEFGGSSENHRRSDQMGFYYRVHCIRRAA